MTGLLIHLVEELELCSPVHTQWMYLVEQYLETLRGYVRNKTNQKEVYGRRFRGIKGGFAHKIWWNLQPQGVGCGMTKNTHQCLMKCLKVVGIHELCLLNSKTRPIPFCLRVWSINGCLA
jgi:hypothetical protein